MVFQVIIIIPVSADSAGTKQDNRDIAVGRAGSPAVEGAQHVAQTMIVVPYRIAGELPILPQQMIEFLDRLEAGVETIWSNYRVGK